MSARNQATCSYITVMFHGHQLSFAAIVVDQHGTCVLEHGVANLPTEHTVSALDQRYPVLARYVVFERRTSRMALDTGTAAAAAAHMHEHTFSLIGMIGGEQAVLALFINFSVRFGVDVRYVDDGAERVGKRLVGPRRHDDEHVRKQ